VIEEVRALIDVAEEMAEWNAHGDRCPAAEWSGFEPECNCGWKDLQNEANAAVEKVRAALAGWATLATTGKLPPPAAPGLREALTAEAEAKLRQSVEAIATIDDDWSLHWGNGPLLALFATLDAARTPAAPGLREDGETMDWIRSSIAAEVRDRTALLDKALADQRRAIKSAVDAYEEWMRRANDPESFLPTHTRVGASQSQQAHDRFMRAMGRLRALAETPGEPR
jgi:hypothetical protein